MKKPAFTLVLCLLLALLTMLRSYAAAADALPHIAPAGTDTLDVPCAAAILIDEDSGTVLYEKNADQQRPIASITKVMTVLLVMEDIKVVTLNQYCRWCRNIFGSKCLCTYWQRKQYHQHAE